MSRESLLARAQAAAEAGMGDACTIRRRNPAGASTNLSTGAVTPAYVAPNPYAGKCRVQQAVAQANSEEAGEDYLLLLHLVVQLPMSVTGLQVSDEVTITASRDPDLVGRTFLIHDLFHKTDASSRRVQVTERTD